jgi:AAA domain
VTLALVVALHAISRSITKACFFPRAWWRGTSCTLSQMLVKGIRSFSPDNNNVIEFYKPLTLIVGSNGAGKTVRSCSP